MVGPTVQDDLFSILIRFRQHKFIVSCDVEKMYRSIILDESQRSLQKIVFRFDPSESLQTYTLNTLTYGTASAPYLATKCLVSLADKASNDKVKSSIQRDFYIDIYISGGDTISETIDLCKEVIGILSSAKFNLRKFQSNSPEILKSIVHNQENVNNFLDLSRNNLNLSTKTSGVNWLCDIDCLSFHIKIDKHKNITKRYILSVISQIFDPLGLVGPCILEAKIIMQRLWINKSDWDETITGEIAHQWHSFANALSSLNNLRTSRCVFSSDAVTREVHVFSDASERAYGACLYIRTVDRYGNIKVSLLTSKNRIAPIKPTTIPRLELCGALLGTRLCTKEPDIPSEFANEEKDQVAHFPWCHISGHARAHQGQGCPTSLLALGQSRPPASRRRRCHQGG
ncbi:uncharacterized protein LOC121728381 isoform X2 [Aricia agestis]|uniref:uncharacterized protein LOC121728381 isoform X2 n=1 Tax=Aricia agestis TaxID=91739 RepID=UPI001C20294E|nr:uncharacterized protein LOC121728381 isoform X2 [Aricia agestis]